MEPVVADAIKMLGLSPKDPQYEDKVEILQLLYIDAYDTGYDMGAMAGFTEGYYKAKEEDPW